MKKKNPKLGAISLDDLGLKAGFRSPGSGEITFKPIVGWASVANYVEARTRAMIPLVLDETSFPTLASESRFPNFVGVFEKAVTADEAKAKLRAGRPIE